MLIIFVKIKVMMMVRLMTERLTDICNCRVTFGTENEHYGWGRGIVKRLINDNSFFFLYFDLYRHRVKTFRFALFHLGQC